MMPSGINHARTQVEALRIALLSPSPEEVGRCLPALEEAARSLTGAEKELRSGAADRLELQALRNELRVVNRLIARGAAFYQGWAKLLGAATAGYMPTGEAAPISRGWMGPAASRSAGERMGNILTTLLTSADALRVYGSVFDTIQNNITNAHTPGYVKQDQSLVARPFDPAASLSGGVLAGPLISARSEYAEQAVRTQQQQLGSAQQKTADLGQIQPLFSLASGSGISGALNKFFDSFSQLSVNPNDSVSRRAVLSTAAQVAQAFHENANGITRVSSNVDSQTRDAASTINRIAAELAALNRHFQENSQSSQDAGLDARVHAGLESLSQVANFTVIKASDGTYSVYLGGQTPLVIGHDQFNISADFSAPQTAIRDYQGNSITSQIDSGQLGALLEEKNTTLPGYLNGLNALAQGFADTLNGALAQGLDKNGNPPATNLFTYDPVAGAAYSLGVSGITPDQIAAALPTGPGGNGNAIAIAALATRPSLNGFTFTQTYGNLGGLVGRDLANAQQEQTAQQNMLAQAQAYRASQSAVSLDEEATKLLQFQQGYQAVGKLVTVLDGLTQTLIDIIH